MALLRQCLMELRAAQELAQSRQSQRGARALPAIHRGVSSTPLPANLRLLPLAGHQPAGTAFTYPH